MTSTEIGNFKHWWAQQAQEQAKNPPSLEQQRSAFDQAHGSVPLPNGCEVIAIEHGSLKGELIIPGNACRDRALLYHHGGGYTFGSALSHRHMVARIAEAAGMIAYNMEYRLAPEHSYPAALQDALANYHYVLEQGIAADRLVVGGESAGGNLTAALLLSLRDKGLPLPAATYLLSPWLDLTQQGKSYQLRQAFDPMLSIEALGFCAQAYCAGHSPSDTYISPINAELHGLPAMLIQVGTDEVLLSDSLTFTEQAALSGLAVSLHVWPDMVHAWPLFHQALPTAGLAAIEQAGQWMRTRLME